MNENLVGDYYWLTLTVLMTGLFWVPYILNRMKENGIFLAVWNPEPDVRPKSQWAERMMRAHSNAVENLAVYAPLVVVCNLLDANSGSTLLAAKVYFFARLLHFLLYTFRVPLLRTVMFLTGFGCQAVFTLAILSAF